MNLAKPFIFILILLSHFTLAQTLMMIGGGSRPKEALEAFVRSMKNPDQPLLILPWGTSQPIEMCELMRAEFLAAGAQEIRCVESSDPDIKGLIKNAGAIYFPGGDQNKIMDQIESYDLKKIIQDQFHLGMSVGGTSAGTAIQSAQMITGNGDETREGLNLFPHCVVDQHFLARSRQTRLAAIMERLKSCGLGIDEGTAVIFAYRRIKIIGMSQVWFYPSPDVLHFRLNHGDELSLFGVTNI